MGCPSCEEKRAAAATRIVKLTVGMAVADDFATASMTIQSLRMHHGMTPDELEILVIDNKPYSPQGIKLKQFCAAVGAVYVAFPEPLGTAPPHNEIFRRATGQVVLAIDSHVLLELGTLQKLMAFARANPFSRDFWHGPLLYDELGDHRNDHLADVWGTDLMYGVWDVDERSKDPNGPPFEIQMHGMGLGACLKDAWPGVPDGLKGFGGTEGMIHALFRSNGRKVWCLPFLRWWHLFRGDWAPNPNPALKMDKFRNYLIWYRTLGMDTAPLMELFKPRLKPFEYDQAIAEADVSKATTLDTFYQRAVQHTSFINDHCPTLRRLVMDSKHVIEIVDKQGPSTAAILAGQPDTFTSFARVPDKLENLDEFVGATQYTQQDQADMWLSNLQNCDLLYIGDCFIAADLEKVLQHCARWSGRWLVIPGLATYGDVGADGGQGLNSVVGPFLKANPEWTVTEAHSYNNGFHVLTCDDRDKRKVPTWWTSAKNYTKALIKFKMAGEPTVDDVTYDLRLAACLMCPERNNEVCGVCTCPVESKALWATEDCPLKPSRWPPLAIIEAEKTEKPVEIVEKPQEIVENHEKSPEEQEMDELAARLSLTVSTASSGQPPRVYKQRACVHRNITTEIVTESKVDHEGPRMTEQTATIQIRCMDCGVEFAFNERPGEAKPVFQLTPLVPGPGQFDKL